MAFRSFGIMNIRSNSTAQPLFGTWIASGIGAPSNIATTVALGSLAREANDAEVLFGFGDPVWLINPDGTGGEDARIQSVQSNDTVTLGPINTSGGGLVNPVTRNTHVSGAFGVGTWILLKQSVNNLFVQLEDNGGSTYTYIGTSPAMTAFFRRLAKLPKVSAGQNPYTWSATENYGGNPFDTSELWILGGSGLSLGADGYVPSYCVV